MAPAVALDGGTVSEAYGTLGAGMHSGLTGHGLVLIDADGNQVWPGDDPSLGPAPEDLLTRPRSKTPLTAPRDAVRALTTPPELCIREASAARADSGCRRRGEGRLDTPQSVSH